MATIVIHAGMPKAGSSAVQVWLRASLAQLKEHGVVVASVDADRDAVTVDVRPYAGGHVNAGVVMELMHRNPDRRSELLGSFLGGLERVADRAKTVIISSEAFAQLFWRDDREALERLDDLGSRHKVVVGYYVRPQHTALEAAWRQWGFRTFMSPARYVRHRAEQLDYRDTLDVVAAGAPNLDLRMRPFRRDLLVGQDVVVDFVKAVLDLPDLQTERGTDTNVGLSLDVVNLLRAAPEGLLGRTHHDNRAFRHVKELFEDLEAPSSDQVQRGRDVLQAWCHERFEAGNRAVIEQLGWDTIAFVPEPDGAADAAIRRLDRLWQPSASPVELEAFFALLEHYVRDATASEAGEDGHVLDRVRARSSPNAGRWARAAEMLRRVIRR